MADYKFITDCAWEQIVGRRAPPLRLCLTYEGFHRWFKERFQKSLDNFFISFCTFEQGGIRGDNYVNVGIRDEYESIIAPKLLRDPAIVIRDIEDFRERTQTLLATSKKLSDTSTPLAQRFDLFCDAWINFAPAYTVPPFFLERMLENAVLSHYPNRAKAYVRLASVVASSVDSTLFKIQPAGRVDASFFRDEDRPLVSLLQTLAGFRDARKSAYEKAWYEDAAAFFRQLSTATNLGEYVEWVSPEEIRRRLAAPSRQGNFPHQCLMYYRGGVHIDYQDEWSDLRDRIAPAPTVRELTGQVAYIGKATGKAQVVLSHGSKDITIGEVLVAKMTTPEHIPMIAKCSAIVTDEGGVTCHAAVVSREYKKPCLVGTKYATKVFKTGDMLEVDAERGVVRLRKN